MTYSRKNKGTCSRSTTVTLDDGGLIQDIQVEDGCDGNLRGMCALLLGRPAAEAAALLEGVRCEDKATSCPHQISLCLKEAMERL